MYSPVLYLTRLKDSTDDSDEVPLSKSLATKSKGKTLPTQRRKGVQDEDELPRARDEMRQTAKRPSGAPGTSAATSTRPAKPILKLKIKRRRVSSPERETDEVSRWRGRPQGHRTHPFSMKTNRTPMNFSRTSQPAFTTTVSRHSYISVVVIEFLLASHTTSRRDQRDQP